MRQESETPSQSWRWMGGALRRGLGWRQSPRGPWLPGRPRGRVWVT